jgi:hypothetical protein
MRTKSGFLGLVVAGLLVGSLAWNGAVRADTVPAPVPTPAPTATPTTKHHHHHHIHGKIESVDATSITIKVHHHHKKGATATTPTTEEKTFKITDKTKVESVNEAGVKSSISVSDLKPGQHVSIRGHEGTAHEITVGHHHHHRKKPVPAATP